MHCESGKTMGKRPSFSPSTISPCGKMLGQRQRRPAIAPPRPLEYGCQSKENYAPIIGKPKYRAELILMLWLFLAHVCESELLIKSTMLTSRLVPSEHFRFDRGFCFLFRASQGCIRVRRFTLIPHKKTAGAPFVKIKIKIKCKTKEKKRRTLKI